MQDATAALDTRPPISPYRPKYIPIEILIDYADKGLTHGEIAELVGCTRHNVSQRLIDAGYTRDRIDRWADHKVKVIQLLQSNIANGLTPAKIKDASLRDSVVAFGILHDKELDLTQGRQQGPVVTVIQAQALTLDNEIKQAEMELSKMMPVIDV